MRQYSVTDSGKSEENVGKGQIPLQIRLFWVASRHAFPLLSCSFLILYSDWGMTNYLSLAPMNWVISINQSMTVLLFCNIFQSTTLLLFVILYSMLSHRSINFFKELICQKCDFVEGCRR